jgi:predicted MFS family arabinose efflux permease
MVTTILSEKKSLGLLGLPALVSTVFVTNARSMVTSLLLVDMAVTFRVEVGVMGLVKTSVAAFGFCTALVMAVISTRFAYKSLMLTGFAVLTVSTIGCYFAWDYFSIVLLYGIGGLGGAMAVPMANALVGKHYAVEQRPRVMGWFVAGASGAYLVGSVVIGYLMDLSGWRLPFLGFILPFTVLGFILASISIPRDDQRTRPRRSVFAGFQGVFSNTSAIACLVGSGLFSAAWQAVIAYGVSFFRQRYFLPISLASLLTVGSSLCYVAGGMLAGRFTQRFGRKTLVVFAAFLASLFLIVYVNVDNVWVSTVLVYVAALCAGIRITASNSLTLEQVPTFRGTMMSLNSAVARIGTVLGTAIGGFLLIVFGYELVGLVLGLIGITATVIYFVFTTDPTRLP